jgi:hypothetical protein
MALFVILLVHGLGLAFAAPNFVPENLPSRGLAKTGLPTVARLNYAAFS